MYFSMKVRVMWAQCAIFVSILAVSTAFEITDEQYYQMPKLFELDNYEECLSSSRGAFCVGTFDLLPHTNDKLLETIRRFSADKFHFNHTHIHRGVCLTQRCSHIQESTLKARFQKCVDEAIVSQYGLETNLTRLQYCKSSRARSRPVDRWDMAFAYIAAAVVLCNVVGTVYDVMRNPEKKPNRYLITWSLIVNWRRLTANYDEGGDPRLAALKPVQGVKAITLILVMMAHSVLVYFITYLHNPQFLEKSIHHPLTAYFQNGTCIVQTFIMASSFLLAYNILLYAQANPKRQLSLTMLPVALIYRLLRITPVYMFVLGVATTWWAHAGDGPLWAPLVGAEKQRCRDKWWAQLLYVNNFYRPDYKCLVHTWFLAVDMQLHLVCSILILALGRRPRAALPVLGALLAGSVITNLAIVTHLQLKPMVTLMFPEYMRIQYDGEPSFKWLYMAPWDSLPAALIGVFTAFLHYTLQQTEYKPADHLWIRVLYRLSVPLMFLWVLGGHWVKSGTAPWLVSLYATVDRPIFTSLAAFFLFGAFNQVDSILWRFLSWCGWEILGRMSLSIFLLHWLFALMPLGVRTQLSSASVYDIGGHWLWVIFLTYTAAVPLHLLVEVPIQKFLQALMI